MCTYVLHIYTMVVKEGSEKLEILEDSKIKRHLQ